ncbi:hypothetical protein [[Phormidium] sp. ETS-05]|uniref:hypothetical protein n=1 Tax=[Phormidium] sp. ETS-05 TaxID=222819 RepID=UPI0018EF0E2C|nr:hypothetical protein [[Phormidium] sp. ETS-05]
MFMTKDSKNQQNSPVRLPHKEGGRLGIWGTALVIVAAVTENGGCPDRGEIRQDIPPRGGDNLMVLTIYQWLITASRDAFWEQRPIAPGSIALASPSGLASALWLPSI